MRHSTPSVGGFLLAATTAVLSGCAAPPTPERAAIGGIAAWLWSTEQVTAAGRGWPVIPPPATAPKEPPAPAPPCDLYSGTPGGALFFAEYAARTDDDAERLNAALSVRGALDELSAHLSEAARTDRDAAIDCGLHTGIAGIGATALEIARLLGEDVARTLAHDCVRELARRSKVMGHGVEWSATTDVIAGGAGIGLFLLAFHQATGDQDALSLATRAGRRLEQLAVRERVGRSWRMDPEFPRVMPNFAHGTAGIAFFLARLAAIGGERRFLEAARDGADHLLSIADQGGGGLRVHHHTPGGEELHYLGWCHGPPGTERLFAELARQTGEARYSDAARALTRTLLDAGLPAPSAGFWNNLGQCCGTAGVIEHLIDVAARTDEDAFGEECFALAQRLGDDLLARGEWKDGALRFMQAEHRTRPAELAAQCGYMQGAAGIGLALMHLEAAAAARGRNRRTRSDAHAVRLPDALPWPTAGGR